MERRGIVLIGSGPSLREINLGDVLGFDTITFNRAYLAWPDWGFAPTLHACLDPQSVSIIGFELPAVCKRYSSTQYFLHRDAIAAGVSPARNINFVDVVYGAAFSTSVERVSDYGNVGAISLQILSYLGYRDVLMIGVDGHYVRESETSHDINHFRDDYAAGRVPLSDAECRRYVASWPVVAEECRRLGLDVRNASPGTFLTCFPQIDLREGLRWLSRSPDHSN